MGKKSTSNMMPLLTAVSVGAALYSVYQNRKPQNSHQFQGFHQSQQPQEHHQSQERHESQVSNESQGFQNENTEDMSTMINSFLGQLK